MSSLLFSVDFKDVGFVDGGLNSNHVLFVVNFDAIAINLVFDADTFRGIQYVGLDIASKGMMRLSLLICWAPKESVNTISMSRNNRLLEPRIHQ